MGMNFFRTAVLAAALTGMAGSGAALAQSGSDTYPSQPVRLVVPAAPGGATDVLARVLTKVIQEQSGVNMIAENRPGASGSIGVAHVAEAKPDGYTLLITAPDAMTIYPLVNKGVSYRVENDFEPIRTLGVTAVGFAVSSKASAKTVKDFVEQAKSGKLSYASAGSGTTSHLVMELFKQRTGIKELLHVPYKGSGPSMIAVIGGEVDITAVSPVSMRASLDAGHLRPLAVSTSTRSSSLPDVPTMVESGYADFHVPAWFGIFAPDGIAPERAEKLDKLIADAIQSPEFRKHAASLGIDPEQTLAGKAFGDYLGKEVQQWQKLIADQNLELAQ